MSNRSPTIRDVAERAGVSVTTVSHVYSGRRQVAAGTRARVLEVGTAIGYQPDASARYLASGKSTSIALEIELAGGSFLVNPYFSSVMSALSVAALQNGFTFTLLPSNPEQSREVHTAIRQKGVAGAIVVEPTVSNRWVPTLVEDGVRVVCIGRYPGAIDTAWVDNDHRTGIREAVEHLAGQGYGRVALLSVHERTSLVMDLESSFEEAVDALGLIGRVVFIGDLVEATAREIGHEILGSRNPPDAIIGVIDRVAVGVIQAATDLGVEIPRSLGVVGLGDTVLARLSKPPFTSIRSTPNELAQEAVRLVRETWLDPGLPNSHVLIAADLVTRESTQRRG